MKSLGYLVLTVTITVLVGIWKSFCIHKAWTWLVMPILHVPALHVSQIFALLLLMNLIKGVQTDNKKKPDKTAEESVRELVHGAFSSFIFAALCLLEAWILFKMGWVVQ